MLKVENPKAPKFITLQNIHKEGDHGRAVVRDGSRAAAISKVECFVIIVNGFQLLTIITKYSILDVAAALDPPLVVISIQHLFNI